jgi:4-hydroxy-tetrahydrodipicolinate reductase
MNILLIGYGKMGKMIERLAKEKGHNIACIIDKDDSWDKVNDKKIDVAIDFSTPKSVMSNIDSCFKRHIPLVVGTTGWYDNIPMIKNRVEKENQSFFYSSNFSIGVYMLRMLNISLAKMMNAYPSYNPKITEIHHIHKLDAPSGTAITLANDLIDNSNKKTSWQLNNEKDKTTLEIDAKRIGEECGTHIISYDSPVDTIEITHKAKTREGFALGAIMAGEFLCTKQGFYTMEDLMK